MNTSNNYEERKALAEAGRALALQVVVSLFSGRETPVEPWSRLAERCRLLASAPDGLPLEPEAEAIAALGEVVCSPDPETASEAAGRIPKIAGCELYALTIDALISDRLARSNPGMAEPRARLADSLYALMPEYHQGVDNYLAGSIRILSTLIEFFACKRDFRGTFAQASSLSAGASHLAEKYGIYRYVDSVVEICERVLAENSGATGRDGVGFWTTAHNLTNLEFILAWDHPAASASHYRKALACAEAALNALKTATGDDVPSLRETTLRKLAHLHALLSQTLAHGSMSKGEEYDSRATRFRLGCAVAAERFSESAKECAERIAAAEGGTEGRARIAAELLGEWYEGLTAELDRAIPASGLDWGVCKLMLALGAIASGRLGELTSSVVRSWVTSVAVPQDSESWTPSRARQYMSTGGESQADRTSAAGRIAGLALLTEAVDKSAPEIHFLEMIRAHNDMLLKRIVEGRPLFQESSGPGLSREVDLEALDRVSRLIFRSRLDAVR